MLKAHRPQPTARPIVVISKCLEFEACRYNGQMIGFEFVNMLKDHVTFLPICPEVEVGLGTPRDPIKIVRRNNALHLLQPTTGRDITDQMRSFGSQFLQSLDEVDGFILKSRSPSCGIKDVKLYTGKQGEMASEKTVGLFAVEVLNRFGGVAIEDEGRLTNLRLREHWLTKLYLHARFRMIRKSPATAALVAFQAENKLLFMAYHQTAMREMGRVVANHGKLSIDRMLEEYYRLLQTATAKPARVTSHINVLEHALGYFKEKLSASEKRHFLKMTEQFRNDKLPLSALLAVLNSWIERFDEPYLRQQSYFAPYPRELVDLSDSGR
jgi:uncharacterized protein YbgA (DUF1722 family)/uncharacterized protein YbbK (DUF523 family)